MNSLERIYAVFLCLTMEDGTRDRHRRAAAFLEMVTTFLLSALTMVVLGFLNLKMISFFLWIAVIAIHGIISYLFFNNYFIRSKRYLKLLAHVDQYRKSKKIAFAFLSVLIVIFSFGLLIGGGILMSYLYSLH